MVKIIAKWNGRQPKVELEANLVQMKVVFEGNERDVNEINWDAPVSGTIYGTLLNFKGSLERMGEQVSRPPYQQPPIAPILYIKPNNTISSDHMPIPLPDGLEELEMGAALGIVFGREAVKVAEEEALQYVEGFTIVNDVSIPHESVYRPPVKYKCRDGFCPVGPWIVKQDDVFNPDDLTMKVYINEKLVQENTTRNLIRSIPRLIADVTEFMTLYPGDVLLAGVPEGAPLAKKGDKVKIVIGWRGSFGKYDRPRKRVGERGRDIMKRARVAYAGEIHQAVESEGKLMLADGRLLEEKDVVWLPPVCPQTVLALGLNYSDHASELSFQAPEEPLIFLKGPNTLIGHRGTVPRPEDVSYMHYECELAAVIGKQAKKVKKEDADNFIAGYTIANDYAFRDYLENYYRPNLRVKNRDACTPLGPWIVDAKDISDPMNLSLKTYVNGELTQEGSTKDMIFSIPYLIEYLSSFMTLNEGDVILTGTPKGTVNTAVGDEVICEIEGIGRLMNTIIAK